VLSRFVALSAVLAFPALSHAQSLDAPLKKIRDSRTVTIAYRPDAMPFSYEQDKQPTGYTVELCKRVVASLEQQLKVQPIAVKWIPATVQNRLDLVRTGKADMECGATTATLSRMEVVDFSSPVFVDVTGLLVRKAAGAKSLADLGGKKIAVVEQTTNQRALGAALKGALVSATVVPVKSRDEAVTALEAGTVDAMAGDKVLLQGLAGGKLKDPSQYELLGDDLAIEPYAIVLPRGASSFRLAVNRALAQIYSSGAIVQVFRGAFGPETKPTPALLVMYGLASYPE
jgi:glutamate/aspartate transport system substrate-binding protein